MPFSWKDRESILAALAKSPPEVLVIGCGVVGAAVAAHAARFGLNVLVLEKADIAGGASGNSTGLAHAGLRYLAQGRVGYVFSEGRERQRLQELAPHWVRPFSFILPAYRQDPYPFWMMRLGTWIYDALGWIDALLTKRPLVRRHRRLTAGEIKAKIPGIRAEGLLGGIEYFVDGKLQDGRFTLGYAQQAAQHGARVLTYCEVLSALVSGDTHVKVAVRDLLGGGAFEFFVPLVINASGAWIDEVRHKTGMAGAVVQKSKGVHLIVDAVADSPLILSTPVKGKVFFVIPIDRERSLVGTTDTAVSGPPDGVLPDDRDIQELLQQLYHYFPYFKQGPNLLEAIKSYKQVHVRDIFWGIRPLLNQGGSTLLASRERRLVKDLPRFWSFPGVKLTSARAAGYEAAAEAWAFVRSGTALPSVSWDSLPGGELWDFDRFVKDAQKRFKLGPNSDATLQYLISQYGTRYVEVVQWAQRETPFSEPVMAGEPWIFAQAAYAAHEEMVLTLSDFLWRRTKWAHYRDLPEETIRRTAGVLARYLGWSDDEVKRQIGEYNSELRKHRLG